MPARERDATRHDAPNDRRVCVRLPRGISRLAPSGNATDADVVRNRPTVAAVGEGGRFVGCPGLTDTYLEGRCARKGVSMSTSSRRPRRKFTPEFKAEAVAMVEASGGQIAKVARELKLHDSSLGNWVREAREQAAGAPTAHGAGRDPRAARRAGAGHPRARHLGKSSRLLLGVAPEERVTIVYTFIAEEKANPDCEWSVDRDVPGAGGVPVGVLRLGVPAAVGAGARRPSADDRDRSDLGVLGAHLRGAAGARLAAAAGVQPVPQAGRSDHAAQRLGGRVRPAQGAHHDHRPARPRRPSDQVGRDFNPTAPNVTWCGDITYLRTGEGWLYLATVIDLFSRRVIGWSLAEHMRTSLVADALETAVATRGGHVDGVVFHSDRGCQYTSGEFGELCDRLGVDPVDGRHRGVLGQRGGRVVLRNAEA